MNARKAFIFSICFTLITSFAIGQVKDKLQVGGYFKLMQITSFGDDIDKTQWDYLFHNRVNMRYKFNPKFKAALEFRNRIFFGETVSNTDEYGEIVDIDNGAVDLSWLFIDADDVVGLIQIDRAWLEYRSDDWLIMAGRQRVNWGINLFWNNHDLFNTYSLVEFDYEERPGSDAIRVTRILGDEHWIEAAVKYPDSDSTGVAALRYAFKMGRYDMKLIGGWYEKDIVGGIGWEGNIKNAGFKGEAAYFHPREDDNDGVLSFSISGDYYFSNQVFVTAGYLFQDAQSTVENSDLIIARFSRGLSAKNLMPFDHNFIFNVSYPLSPILNGSMMATWSPGFDASFLMGSLMYSLADNWEIGAFGQSFIYNDNSWNNPVNSIYLRVKNSF
jgi:hypothetical protein